MNHTCHAPGCTLQVPARMFACRTHWFALPQKIRNAIWREYRDGQEVDKKPSLRYLAVQQLACAHSVFKPYDENAAKEAIKYLARAVGFAREAVREGFGDPLFGLSQRIEEL
jgi:hypothetical protein